MTLTPEQKDEIYSIYFDNFPHYMRRPRKEFLRAVEHYTHWDIQTVGPSTKCFALLTETPMYVYLEYLAISRAYQGGGTGSKYLWDIYQRFSKPSKLFLLDCEDRLVRFYERNGFYRVPIARYEYHGVKMNVMIHQETKRENPDTWRMAYRIASTLMNVYRDYFYIAKYLFIYYYLVFSTVMRFHQYRYHVVDAYKEAQ